MYLPDNINTVLNSVIKNGSSSILLNRFLEICMCISKIVLLNSKYRDLLLKKTGCTIQDLSLDLIADLFEVRRGKYYYLNRYFGDISNNITKLPKQVVTSRLFSLISSAVNQRISDIRQEFGESYFKIKKAVDICLTRKPDAYRKKKIREYVYIYSSSTRSLRLKFEQMPREYIVPELYKFDYRTYQVPEVMSNIYSVVNRQDEYSRALELTSLINCVVDFYRNRIEGHLNNGQYPNLMAAYNA
jgi:hypothetical protein